MILGYDDIKHYLETHKIEIKDINETTIRENGIDCRIGDTIAIDIPLWINSTKPTNTLAGVTTLATVTNLAQQEGKEVIDTHNLESVHKRFDLHKFSDSGEIIPAKTNILLVTKEEFLLPDDVMAFCCLRSTVARNGFISPITIVDAGFQGTLTIESWYGGNNPIKIYKGDRFLHIVFAKINSPVSKPYNGIYKGQTIVRLPKCIN